MTRVLVVAVALSVLAGVVSLAIGLAESWRDAKVRKMIETRDFAGNWQPRN